MKLWACEMLRGDNNGNFLPKANGTRAEAAAFSMRTHNIVTKWAEEIDSYIGKTEETNIDEEVDDPKVDTDNLKNNQQSSNRDSNDSDRNIVYFDTNGGYPIGKMSVRSNNALKSVPLPKKENFIFLGWYKDDKFENRFYAEEPIKNNMTLYAKYGKITAQEKFVDESFSFNEPKLKSFF